ncbi:tyrosine-type recombinase/integrase [Peribacillus huizhouensis]
MLGYYRGLRRREQSYFAYRGYMLIITFLGTGLRRTEIINLKWSDVDLGNLTMSVYGKNRK